jgi:lipoyl(octanoyl) transferase
MQICLVHPLGTVEYDYAWSLQKSLATDRGQQQRPDSLLLLEHPHTYTLGSSGKMEHLLFDEAERAKRGISVHHVDRGGDITYHGPGQLVGYPIVQLPRSNNGLRTDVIGYVRNLEAMLIQAIAPFSISGERLSGYTGVWVNVDGELQKIAAIGVKVTTKSVTFHGFALNVNTDLDYFRGIIPCGIPDKPVTSMEKILGYTVDMTDVSDAIIASFGDVFDRDMLIEKPEAPLIPQIS